MLKRILSGKLFYMVLSLFSAICLWFFVLSMEATDYETWINDIPVTITGEELLLSEESLILSSGRDSTINLKLMGRASDLNRLDNSNITVSVDLGEITRSGSYNLSYDIDFPDSVNEDDVSILDRSSNYVRMSFSMLERKSVEVRGELEGGPAEGYMAGTMSFDYETIEIRGPEEVLGLVSHALVVLQRTNLTGTVVESVGYTLIGYNGEPVDSDEISSDVSEIEVTLPVLLTKKVPLAVELIEGGGASGSSVSYDIEPTFVELSGDADVLDAVNRIDLGTIDLSTVITDQTTIDMPVIIPNEVKNLSGIDTARVTLKLSGLAKKVLRVSSIELVNAPDEYEADAVTQSLQVLVRAPEDTIDLILANNVRVVADLSDISEKGQYEIPANVYIDGYSDAGVVNSYTIVVNISDRLPEEPEATPRAGTRTETEGSGAFASGGEGN